MNKYYLVHTTIVNEYCTVAVDYCAVFDDKEKAFGKIAELTTNWSCPFDPERFEVDNNDIPCHAPNDEIINIGGITEIEMGKPTTIWVKQPYLKVEEKLNEILVILKKPKGFLKFIDYRKKRGELWKKNLIKLKKIFRSMKIWQKLY
jgi:hypothetical protein